MPDNVLYAQLAYGATIVLLAGYALSIALRRRALARRRERQRAP
jgi:heme exporter protein D